MVIMSRLLVLGMLPLAALSASKGAMGADALSVATKVRVPPKMKPLDSNNDRCKCPFCVIIRCNLSTKALAVLKLGF